VTEDNRVLRVGDADSCVASALSAPGSCVRERY